MLIVWIVLRAALWERIELPGLPVPVQIAVARVMPQPALQPNDPVGQSEAVRAISIPSAATAGPVMIRRPAPTVPAPPLVLPVVVAQAPIPEFQPTNEPFDNSHVAAAHQLAWMAGVAQLPIPRFVVERLNQRGQPSELAPAEARPGRQLSPIESRWSVDGWLLLRDGGVGITPAGLPAPSYGASQAGAVVRYRLAPTSGHRAAAYFRASSALHAPRGEEVALGVSARPLANLPIAVQAELRATRQTGGTSLRPAIGAITELPRFTLRAGLSGEAYGQAGYVGGPGATPFVDGQMRIEQRLGQLGRGELRIGLGAWGGAQKGARRIDLGPSATIDFPIGGGQGRVSADWRLRAAGNAAPQSGPAVTLSAGF